MILGTRLSVKIVFTALKLKDNRPWRERNYALQFLRLEPGLASHVPDLPPELTFIYFGFFRNDAAHCLVGNEGDEKTENHDEALTAALLAGVSSAARSKQPTRNHGHAEQHRRSQAGNDSQFAASRIYQRQSNAGFLFGSGNRQIRQSRDDVHHANLNDWSHDNGSKHATELRQSVGWDVHQHSGEG